jgi:DNA polymerase I-like protein with 3'-5' exonuclease and polymerase domains
LIAWQRERLAKEELLNVQDIECRLIPVLVRQTMLGIRIDEERLHKLHSDIGTQVEQLLRGFPEGFNPKSPSDVQKWCEANGATDWPLTEKLKRPSFPESWLETHTAGLAVVKIRKLKTLLSSFIQPMLDTHLFNGRVHADYNQLRNDDFGTIPGRLSSSNPNLMQIPHHSDYTLGRAFRSIFIPDEGKIWGSRDYSQCLVAGTKVTVPGGTKNIEDMKPGDLEYSYDNSRNLVLRKVTWAGQTGVRPVVRLKWATNGRT